MNPLDLFSSSKGQPDWSGDIGDVDKYYNQLRAGIDPSQGAMNQASQLQNQMTNQQYNQGLSGSTIANQALGSGEMNAFQQDLDKQTQQALGMFAPISQGNLQAQMMPTQQLGQFLGQGMSTFAEMLPLLMMG